MNYTDNPVGNLHACLAHAVYQGFDDIVYEDRDWEHYQKTKEDKRITKTRKHSEYDISVQAMFPQVWGSTALGFGGIGGAAMTTAYTIVLTSDVQGHYCVYFGSQLAYKIDRPNRVFFEDVANMSMHARAGAKERYEETAGA